MGYTEIALDKQFKERLTGAVILVVLIVAFVPALLTGPRRADPRPADAAQEGPPLRSYTIDLTEDGRSGQTSITRSAAPEPKLAEPTPAAQPKPVAEPDAATKPVAEEAPAPDAAVPPASRPAPNPAPPVVAPRSAQPSVSAGYAVQVGSFSSKANADRLVGELRKQGFAAFLSATPAPKRLYRVRVGPVADRPAAEGLATRLASFERPGRVVTHP